MKLTARPCCSTFLAPHTPHLCMFLGFLCAQASGISPNIQVVGCVVRLPLGQLFFSRQPLSVHRIGGLSDDSPPVLCHLSYRNDCRLSSSLSAPLVHGQPPVLRPGYGTCLVLAPLSSLLCRKWTTLPRDGLAVWGPRRQQWWSMLPKCNASLQRRVCRCDAMVPWQMSRCGPRSPPSDPQGASATSSTTFSKGTQICSWWWYGLVAKTWSTYLRMPKLPWMGMAAKRRCTSRTWMRTSAYTSEQMPHWAPLGKTHHGKDLCSTALNLPVHGEGSKFVKSRVPPPK